MARSKKKPLSLEVNVQVLPQKGMKLKIEPDAAQLKLIADEADIVSVERFVAELEFRRWQRKGVSVTGHVSADITQECVVTLEPVKSTIREEIDRTFLPEGSKLLKPKLDDEGELVLDVEGRDEPEMFGGVTLDAFAIALEHFILGIDPFPRKEGAEFGEMISGEEVSKEDAKESPFAALKDLFKPE